MKNKKVKFVDLFAGMGGIRKGFELACESMKLESECVFTSEIKPHAVEILKQNNSCEKIHGDITKINEKDIPDFDFLLAGFPCQAFSSAGKRLGFLDTRGTLYFEVERILKEKKPKGFILENVEGLVIHDRKDKKSPIGQTLSTILQSLENLGYKVEWKVLNSKYFGVPQERKRIYIIGTDRKKPEMNFQVGKVKKIKEILESGLPTVNSKIVSLLLSHFSAEELQGKAIKDKRGGKDNIHSWDIELKGKVTNSQKELLNKLLTERRKKKWAYEYGIEWMDGMPLTKEHIKTFYDVKNLEEILEDLVNKGYLKKEYPKRKIAGKRVQDTNLPIGYNIVTGKMSFEINKILNPESIAPTLVAMDMRGLFVVDGKGLRNLSLREGLRLFGYPEDFKFEIEKSLGYDLLGNTVVVPAIEEVSKRVLKIYY
ncbi:DNA (cytosine-5-)-methyltransferase [uncultured Leptotrichia sp.]|uniref:DNA (cytosine-5-)-methyltransferase n=1 Tax=uncultured Leptotrichia sp. TaxID=159271 RepID=UPI0026147798|nr:DNA (cytosine-5-)-methyltransferase [uncultured Leptotrichia sp.]